MAAIPSSPLHPLAIVVVVAAMLILLPSASLAGDADLLQDICVADLTSSEYHARNLPHFLLFQLLLGI